MKEVWQPPQRQGGLVTGGLSERRSVDRGPHERRRAAVRAAAIPTTLRGRIVASAQKKGLGGLTPSAYAQQLAATTKTAKVTAEL